MAGYGVDKALEERDLVDVDVLEDNLKTKRSNGEDPKPSN
jgi:hypothetical protein